MTEHYPFVVTSGTDNSLTLADGVKIFNEELGRLRSLVAIQEVELLHYKMKEKERIRNSVSVEVEHDESRFQHTVTVTVNDEVIDSAMGRDCIAAEIINEIWMRLKGRLGL